MKAGRWLAGVGWMTIATLSVFAAEVKIIANGSVRADSVSVAELRGVFLLQRKTLQDGSPVNPVLLRFGATHEAFLRQYLDRRSEELQIYYQSLVFTGKGSMPKQLNSEEEVIAYVARTRGAIGYVSEGTNSDGVKTLTVGSEGSRRERTLLKRVEPDYPETLQRLHISGTVRLELRISPNGNVEAVMVMGGNPILAENAVKAVKQWVYSSASSHSTVQVTIPFEAKP